MADWSTVLGVSSVLLLLAHTHRCSLFSRLVGVDRTRTDNVDNSAARAWQSIEHLLLLVVLREHGPRSTNPPIFVCTHKTRTKWRSRHQHKTLHVVREHPLAMHISSSGVVPLRSSRTSSRFMSMSAQKTLRVSLWTG